MPRYEFSEGTSNKFWEITLVKGTFTTRWGRIGSDGQAKTQDCGTPEDAKKEYDKLIAEKVKKGYRLVPRGGGAPAVAVTAAPPVRASARDDDDDDDDDDAGDEDEVESAEEGDGARRFEFTEGASNKFWEISLEGEQFTARWGRIGTTGQAKTQDFDSPAAAKKAYDKLVAEKVKKGYRETSGGGGGGGSGGRGGGGGGGGGGEESAGAGFTWNDELEAAILKNPDDPQPYLVYADWLQANGNPVGELIILQHANKAAAAEKLLATHLKSWIGEVAVEALEAEDLKLTWKNGFIRTLWVGHHDTDSQTDLPLVLGKVLRSPVGRFVAAVTLGLAGYDDGEPSAQSMVNKLVALAPKSVTSLEACDFEYPDQTEMSWAYVDDLSAIWRAFPQLQHVTARAGNFTLGTIEAPELRSFRAETGGLNAENVESICQAKWPKLESLHVWFGAENYGFSGGVDDIADLLAATGLPNVKHLGLMNAEFTNQLIPLLAKSKILPQLQTLDLSKGVLDDVGAAALVANSRAFKHLKKLVLSENYLTEDGTRLARSLGNHVETGEQREPYSDDPDDRYAAVGE